MARASTAQRLDESPSVSATKRPGFASGDPPEPPVRPNVMVIDNARLAVMMFLGAEAMFFAGLIGAFIVFRVAAAVWPPSFQPRLPVFVTGVNTVILLISALTMRMGLRAIRSNDSAMLIRYLALTAALGGIFLAIQGYEWVGLIHFGLTVSSSVYGSLFYTLIGAHAVHVLGALAWLGVVLLQAKNGRFTAAKHTGLQTCAMYWNFVVALWPVLYGLVYLY
jgi:cytochrome c oxidase subunit 3